jgi:integrase
MTKVKLREKPMSDNRHSLYLDFYPPIPNPATGKPTRREFLSLYIFDKPKGELEKQHNKETKGLAENIRAQRQLSIQANNYGFLDTKTSNGCFIEYFSKLALERSNPATRSKSWYSALSHLKQFAGDSVRFCDLDERFCKDFREYLLQGKTRTRRAKKLSRSSASTYFGKLKTALGQAHKDGLLIEKIGENTPMIDKRDSPHREYLTIEELRAAVAAECDYPILKTAALFSALTGLRYSDIEKLVWGEVRYSKAEGYSLQFTQQKTQGNEVLPISDEAFNLLGERGDPKKKVFEGLNYSAYNNIHLKTWLVRAGIGKKITFHCFRHTYATLQLTLGADIYTVSKMLGHRDLRTTEVYAKIINSKKREAANRISLNPDK